MYKLEVNTVSTESHGYLFICKIKMLQKGSHYSNIHA